MRNSMLLKSGIPLLIILVAIIAAAVMIGAKKPPEQKPVESKPFLVDAMQINSEDVHFKVYSQGNVIPKHQTNISAQVSGKIVEVSDTFVAGGLFNEGDLLVRLEQEDYATELKLAEAELVQANAALTEEKARGKVAEQEWRSVNSSIAPELGLRKPQLATAQANVKAAEAKFERAQRNLARTEIRAPYDGLVVSKNVDLGQFITTGAVIGTIYSTDEAEIRLPIPDSDMAFIDITSQIKQASPVTLTATVAGKKRAWEAELVRSEGILDTGNRVIYVIAKLDDPYARKDTDTTPLRFGQFVEAEITGTQSQQLFVLPRNVLRLDNTVLQVTDDRNVKINPVEVVRTNANYVYISSGLDEESQVITSAVPNPYNGMKVRLPGDEVPTNATPENDKADDSSSIDAREAAN
ncbi:efflux RND transporter periplasmic adaptor subunit [Alteromonas sp. ASW11-130]|uniref:efflux RND transporter periplasmic adaptor subunit n=1 Tax=Alteromonas sp. ASW11-130 TaxID=3015775 RepID=UPI002241F9E3|nr:efflux RND transporter periplasmic adaptor subunit [Alteromonas sp. ASW11-130]MCW8092053.1 efflux RND transporter periplasmic adaptor subunit [Alteromonas sp. ASW11-130]